MEKSPQTKIADASRMQQIMRDDIVIEAFARLERKYWTEFKGSTTAEERVRTWAKANVLDDIKRQMQITVDAGEHEVMEATRRVSPLAPRT